MKRYYSIVGWCVGLIWLTACHSSPVDIEAEKNKLLVLHEQQRMAHLERNPELLVAQLASPFISIAQGEVEVLYCKDNLNRFKGYFERMKFKKWEDITPPQIEVSDDGTMAYIIAHECVEYVTIQNTTSHSEEEVFAWTAIYQKHHGEWRMTCITSTNKYTP